ncbi:MAG: hypothetical protein HKN09_10380, partial [Saprospiraceae bacterium]|nr:hypothetical protein [Saprospiraceae bacterium]
MKKVFYLSILVFSLLTFNSHAQESETQSIQNLWKNAINSKHKLEQLYTTNAVKLFSSGKYVEGGQQIATDYLNNPNEIKFINTLYSVEARKERQIQYEIGTFKDKNDYTYIYLWVWNNQDDKPKIELDYFDGLSDAVIDSTGLNKSRNAWMRYCNAHDVEGLIR